MPDRRENRDAERDAILALIPPSDPPARTIGAADLGGVDAGDLVSLLRAGRTAELDALFAAAQDAFEHGVESEMILERWMEAFAARGVDPAWLDAWASGSPGSFAALGARAAKTLEVALDAPPVGCAPDHHPVLGGDALRTVDAAKKDLEAAVAVRPRFVAAYALLIRAVDADRSAPAKQILDRAVAICPRCSTPRERYMMTLRPEVGGSLDAMRAFARESRRWLPENPRLAALAGYADVNECWASTRKDHLSEALEACRRAVSTFPSARFLAAEAAVLYRLDRNMQAVDMNTRALEDDSGSAIILVERARARSALGQWSEAGRDLREALRLSPGNHRAGRLLAWLVDRIEREAEAELARADLRSALAMYDVGLAIVPGHPLLQRARLAVALRAGVSRAR